MNRQRLSEILGMAVVISHIIINLYFWFLFGEDSNLIIKEISTPLTVAYVTAVIKWFIDNKEYRLRTEKVRPAYAFIAILTVCLLIVSMPIGVFLYKTDMTISASRMNEFFVFVQSVFGFMFALIMGDLFASRRGSDKAH